MSHKPQTMSSTTSEKPHSTNEKDLEAQSTHSSTSTLVLSTHTLKVINERTALILSRDNIHNTSLDNDALGLHYKFTTDTKGWKCSGITRITRWDVKTEQEVLVAEWKRNAFKKDKLRMTNSMSDELLPAADTLKLTSGLPYCPFFNRTLTVNGEHYTWKARCGTLKLYSENKDSKEPVASTFRRRYIFRPRNAFIELHPGYEDIVDHIVVTWAIARQRQGEGELVLLILELITDVLVAVLTNVL